MMIIRRWKEVDIMLSSFESSADKLPFLGCHFVVGEYIH